MQNAEAVLEVIRERGRRGLPLERLYRQLYPAISPVPAMGYLGFSAIASTLLLACFRGRRRVDNIGAWLAGGLLTGLGLVGYLWSDPAPLWRIRSRRRSEPGRLGGVKAVGISFLFFVFPMALAIAMLYAVRKT
jgi:hypothetical protein